MKEKVTMTVLELLLTVGGTVAAVVLSYEVSIFIGPVMLLAGAVFGLGRAHLRSKGG